MRGATTRMKMKCAERRVTSGCDACEQSAHVVEAQSETRTYWPHRSC